MRESNRNLDVGTHLLCPVANAVHLQRLFEARLHANDHVLEKRPGQSVQGAVVRAVAGAGHDDLVVVQHHAYIGVDVPLQLANRTLDGDRQPIDLYIDGGWNGYRLLTYA